MNLSNEFVVASFEYEKYLSIEGSKDILGYTFKYREDPIILDPRNKGLGARLIINLEKLYLSLKKLDLKDDKIEKYYNESHKLGIVPKNLNQLQNKIFGIECNYEELNGIDFKKGCYVGQENTARIKLNNKLSKRLLPIEIINGKLSKDEKIYNNDVEIGKVLINEEYPFALIKYLNKNFNKDQIFQSKNKSIGYQSENELFAIMRSIYLQYANSVLTSDQMLTNLRTLNKAVVDYAVGNIGEQLDQYNAYLEKISSAPVPMERPQVSNTDSWTYDMSNILF